MTADRFALMVADLAGEPPPPLPNLPGRVHVCEPEDDARALPRERADVGELLDIIREGLR